MKVFINSIVILILLNLYLICKIRQTTLKDSKFGRILQWLVGAFLLSFLVFYSIRSLIPYERFGPIMLLYNNYFVAMCIYVSVLLVIGLCTRLFMRFWGRKRGVTEHDLRRWYGYMMGLFFLFLILACNKGYHNTMEPILTTYDIHIDKDPGMEEKKDLKIALITDIHIGEIIGLEQVEHLVEMVNHEKPDVIMIGGDMIDYDVRYAYHPGITEAMKQLKAPMGTYYIMGNHEYRDDVEAKKRWFRSLGTLLIDSVAVLPGTDIQLIGRDDETNKERAALPEIMQKYGVDTSKPILLLDHQPIRLNEELENSVDLGMYGHTHNGQFYPFTWLVQLKFECAHGLIKKGKTSYCISCGYGVAGSPFRVGTRSEMVILNVSFGQ